MIIRMGRCTVERDDIPDITLRIGWVDVEEIQFKRLSFCRIGSDQTESVQYREKDGMYSFGDRIVGSVSIEDVNEGDEDYVDHEDPNDEDLMEPEGAPISKEYVIERLQRVIEMLQSQQTLSTPALIELMDGLSSMEGRVFADVADQEDLAGLVARAKEAVIHVQTLSKEYKSDLIAELSAKVASLNTL